jgi:transcriptional regulator with XRE-family HTH domain
MMNIEYKNERQYYSAIRRMKKIRLKYIAEVLGVSIPLLSMWESSKTNMNSYLVINYKQIIDNK